ncbi:hypothetical protein [Actinospica robiniae]|uniref:hypothetical protein n=1 Tax=Actinospica robiniae TaxID=304901 RepID=UPI0004216EDD|nr:hypothetical protein [Actinospica robiniae]
MSDPESVASAVPHWGRLDPLGTRTGSIVLIVAIKVRSAESGFGPWSLPRWTRGDRISAF